MKIAVVKKNLDDNKIKEGYKVVGSKGESEYLIWISSDKEDPYVPIWSEIDFNFKTVKTDSGI
jgi:hypothetical protein